MVLSMVAQGIGMAIMPRLTLLGAPGGLAVTDLGPEPPTRQVGYVTTPELAGTAAGDGRAVVKGQDRPRRRLADFDDPATAHIDCEAI